MQHIARNSLGPINRQPVLVIVVPGRDIDRFTRVGREGSSEVEPFACLEGAEHVEFVALIIVRAGPIRVRRIAVRREIRDAARIVVRLAEIVASLAREEFSRSSTEAELDRVALQVALGLKLSLLSQLRVRPRRVGRRSWSVCIDRTEQVDASRADIVHKERAARIELPFDTQAVLNCVWDSLMRVEHDNTCRNRSKLGLNDRVAWIIYDEFLEPHSVEMRSEERRVGKE